MFTQWTSVLLVQLILNRLQLAKQLEENKIKIRRFLEKEYSGFLILIIFKDSAGFYGKYYVVKVVICIHIARIENGYFVLGKTKFTWPVISCFSNIGFP